MKNDGHKWDNKNPTAQMLGRWQPWHEGHQKLFEEIIKKTGQVNIMVRDVKGVDLTEAPLNTTNGDRRFRLIFDPLPASVEEIYITEGERKATAEALDANRRATIKHWFQIFLVY